jgi:hypothetical protein
MAARLIEMRSLDEVAEEAADALIDKWHIGSFWNDGADFPPDFEDATVSEIATVLLPYLRLVQRMETGDGV